MKYFTAVYVILCAVSSLQMTKCRILEPIDLTWSVDENSMSWPGTRSFVYTRKLAEYRDDGHWYALNEFCTGEHVGTHLDAPYHFYKHGWKVADIPMQRLLAHAVVVDISEAVKRLGPDTLLQEADLVDWERIHGKMPRPCVVLVRFGWTEYYKSKEEYLGINNNGSELLFPGISAEAAQWMANSGNIVGVGVDTASVDSGSSTSFDAHRILAENQIYNMENVNIPERLPARGFDIVVMPMKLKEGSGSPLRVVAIPEIVLSTDVDCSMYDNKRNNVPWYGQTSVVLCSLLLLGMYAINSCTL